MCEIVYLLNYLQYLFTVG